MNNKDYIKKFKKCSNCNKKLNLKKIKHIRLSTKKIELNRINNIFEFCYTYPNCNFFHTSVFSTNFSNSWIEIEKTITKLCEQNIDFKMQIHLINYNFEIIRTSYWKLFEYNNVIFDLKEKIYDICFKYFTSYIYRIKIQWLT